MTEQTGAGAAHATTGTYLRIAAILVMITLIEVGVFYVPAFQNVLVPLLLVLSAVKFTLVVMFYMHLKFDNRFFAFLLVDRCSLRSSWWSACSSFSMEPFACAPACEPVE